MSTEHHCCDNAGAIWPPRMAQRSSSPTMVRSSRIPKSLHQRPPRLNLSQGFWAHLCRSPLSGYFDTIRVHAAWMCRFPHDRGIIFPASTANVRPSRDKHLTPHLYMEDKDQCFRAYGYAESARNRHNSASMHCLSTVSFGDNNPALPLLAHRNQTRLKMQVPGTEYEVKKPCAALRKCQKPHAAAQPEIDGEALQPLTFGALTRLCGGDF
ncbi:hypothetical protein C8R45DRAFT_927099 [Mycena sanguinolenta]|nr:hypothetical protein C8R45DRAFT_927099 [Mycena sanguinolenta]